MASTAHLSFDPGDNPICSVCVANYNGIDILGPCIDSVLAQDFGLPVEIIVHDDASTDDSVTFLQKRYPQIQLIVSPENVGFCVSNNRMATKARGKYLLLLNNDAMLNPDAMRTLYVFASHMKMPGILSVPQYDMSTGELIDIGCELDLFLAEIPNRDPKKMHVAKVMGACLWIPKTLWHDLGGFPEWFESLTEETFLCYLARLRGHPVVALPESGFHHWVGWNMGGGKLVDGRMRTTYRRRARAERNKCYTMFICYPAPFFHIIFPLHLMLLVLEGLVVSCLKRDPTLWRSVYLNCFREVWNSRKRLTRMRKEVQRHTVPGTPFFKHHSLVPHKLRMLLAAGLPEIE